MNKLKRQYKFLSVENKEIDIETGRYPLDQIVPFGPEHTDVETAENWLSEHFDQEKKYLLVPIYSKEI